MNDKATRPAVLWTCLCVLLLLCITIYLPGLSGPALLDDLRTLAPLSAIAQGQLPIENYLFATDQGVLFRPVANASFVLNWWLWGDNLYAFKAINLALHLLCGLCIFILTRALLRLGFSTQCAAHLDFAALFLCAMWLLSPLLISTVLYTVQRMAQLSTLFVLLGLILYTYGRLRRSSLLGAISLLVMWPLAVLSKENGALLPLLAACIEWFWLPKDVDAKKWRAVLITCMAIPIAIFAAKVLSEPTWLLAYYERRDFTITERLMTQARVLFDYVGNLLLLPGSTAMGLFHDDYLASRSLLAPPQTLISILAWMAGLVFALRQLLGNTRPSSIVQALGFSLVFYLGAHVIEGSIFALELYFEHRNYLPAVAVFFALASVGMWLVTHMHARLIATIAIVIVLGNAALSMQRVDLWRDETQLYTHAVAAHPRSARAWLAYASTQFQNDDFQSATRSLKEAANIMGPSAEAAIALQSIAAHCLKQRAIPESLWQQLRNAPELGGNLITLNGLAWMAGAFENDLCSKAERQRVRQIIQTKSLAPIGWDAAAEQLRATHLKALLSSQ